MTLASGPGQRSAVFRTSDGGATWESTLRNPDETGFFDALAFSSRTDGYLIGDPVGGAFVLYKTTDAGVHWTRLRGPDALPGEGLFAASGTCLVAAPNGRDLWFGTGGAPVARVLHSADGGSTWTSAPVPVKAGVKSAGVFSLAAGSDGRLLAVGGDFARPDSAEDTAALSTDGGAIWRSLPGLSGYRSAAVFSTAAPHDIYAVGTNGSDVASASSKWLRFSQSGLNVVASSPAGTIWAAGPHGLLAKLRANPSPL